MAIRWRKPIRVSTASGWNASSRLSVCSSITSVVLWAKHLPYFKCGWLDPDLPSKSVGLSASGFYPTLETREQIQRVDVTPVLSAWISNQRDPFRIPNANGQPPFRVVATC
jgi:hypothetical protein